MEREKIIKKPIVILQASFDERYLICSHSRAKFSILDTQTDTFVFEKKIRPATSMCFSADDSELYVYDSGKKTVEIIAVGTWESLSVIEIPEFRKADKDNWGDIHPTKNGFCMEFCWKGVMDGENLRWNIFFYDRKTGEKRIFENCAYMAFDASTKDTIGVWQDRAYAVLSQENGVEREFYRNEEYGAGVAFFTAKYTLKCRKYKEKYNVSLMTAALENEAWSAVCKCVLDFPVYTCDDDFLQKDKLVLRGRMEEMGEKRFAVTDMQGNILAQTRAKYAFSAVVANGKFYVADWERLIILPLEQ